MGETRGNAVGAVKSELRLAVTFTGGVSLAVWMGGVAREMNLLLTTGRTEKAARAVRAKYRALLDLLRLEVSVDVLSGTSAGGINAAFLGLANARNCDMVGLRDLWLDKGSLDLLLRDPSEKAPPSLLKGDDGLLKRIQEGLNTVLGTAPSHATKADGPTMVFITTTFLDGVPSTFEDDFGTAVRDTDHRGLFTFTDDQLTQDHLPALALAARASASFPGAFEPAFVPIGKASDNTHPDMSPYLRVTSWNQYCADGGLLANRPLGPALQAVFDRPAHTDVRRVLAYVVPSPGVAPVVQPPAKDAVPALGPALLKDLNAALSQSISADLAALTAHNRRVAAQQQTEFLLAPLLAQASDATVDNLCGAYRTALVSTLARDAADQAMARLSEHGRQVEDGGPVGFGTDLEQLTAKATGVIGAGLPSALPPPDGRVYYELGRFGRPALDGAKATVLSVLHEARTAMPGTAGELDEFRQAVHGAMPRRTPSRMREAMPGALPNGVPTIANIIKDPDWLNAVRQQLPSPTQVSLLAEGWRKLARIVVKLAVLQSGRAGYASGGVLAYLTREVATLRAEDLAQRLFTLHAAQQLLHPDPGLPRQRVELVQMSADTRTLLDDTRSLASQKLTGLQLHHFGAFYKASWRASDWMWGRLDGAGWLVHALLSPPLLAQLGERLKKECEGSRGGADVRDRVMSQLADIAGESPPTKWKAVIKDELGFLTGGAVPETGLPVTSMWVAWGLQRLIAAEELRHVAEQARCDREKGAADTERAFLNLYKSAPLPKDPADADPQTVEQFFRSCKISGETLAAERGTMPLTRTLVQSAAVASNAAGAATIKWKATQTLFGTLSRALRLAHAVLRPDWIARRPAVWGLVALVLGMVVATSPLTLFSALGLLLMLVGVILLVAAVSISRLTFGMGAVLVLAVAVLTAAAAIPLVANHLFPWLRDQMIPYLRGHAWAWAALVVVLLLPSVRTLFDLGRSLLGKRKRSVSKGGGANGKNS
ncbi:patatin-like protein [Streptomyces galilaeus]